MPATRRNTPKTKRLTVSERLDSTPIRYFKRGGKVMARCCYCRKLVNGGMRAMMKHADNCKEWDISARIATDTPEEVHQEIRRLNQELAKCRKRLREK